MLIAPCLVNLIMADMEVVGICIGADPELDFEGPSDSFYCLFHARTFLVHVVGKFLVRSMICFHPGTCQT